MRFPTLVLLCALTLPLGGCGGGKERHRDQHDHDHDHAKGDGHRHDGDPARGANERKDDKRDAAVDARSGWDKLGERVVDGKGDRDTIAVGARDGRFTRVMLVVEHSAIELDDVKIEFGDGDHFSPGTRLVFDKKTVSRVIDLPGGARVIKKVTFRYGNLPGGGRASVELWAK